MGGNARREGWEGGRHATGGAADLEPLGALLPEVAVRLAVLRTHVEGEGA